MIDACCHCGEIHLAVAAAPEDVNNCDCSIRRRYGALWAYYHPSQVRLVAGDGSTDVYIWGERKLGFHRCRGCGCVTHWSAVDRSWPRMGVNARMMPSDLLVDVPVLKNGRASGCAFLQPGKPTTLPQQIGQTSADLNLVADDEPPGVERL